VVSSTFCSSRRNTHVSSSIFVYNWVVLAIVYWYLIAKSGLPQDIFNYPLRRDLMHRLYQFRINLNKFTTKTTKTRGMVHGSSAKLRPQKGQGAARIGSKKAPHLYRGGKAHGSKPKMYSFPLNAKIKINALKALLSAKMAEGKIRVVDS